MGASGRKAADMKTWNTLSGAFAAPNGLTVEPVGSDAGLEEMGLALRNGLMMAQARDLWADLCIEGKRQIFGVRDAGGGLVANGELKTVGGQVRTIFVRGRNNVEMRGGSPEHAAVEAYVAAVNARTIPLAMLPQADGFVEAAPAAAPAESSWERAIRFARENVISPFAALVMGADPAAVRPEAGEPEAFVDTAWAPLSAPFSSGGYVVEPVGNRSGLRRIGVELENNLFLPQMTAHLAERCASGERQIAVVYSEADGVVAYADLTALNGQIQVKALRGYADEDVPPAVAEAVRDYVSGINERRIETAVALGGLTFRDQGDEEPEEGLFRVGGPAIPMALREEPAPYEDGYQEGYGDEGEEGPEEAEGADPVAEVDAGRWEALTGPFVAPNGLVVEPVTERETLQAMGERFRNALEAASGMWAARCARGTSQIVRVMSGQGPDAEMLSNAELVVQHGEVVSLFNRGDRNGLPSEETFAALRAYLAAVNDREIELRGEVGERGFVFEAPAPRPGM